MRASPETVLLYFFSNNNVGHRMSALSQQLNLDLRFTAYDEISNYLDDSRSGYYAIGTKQRDGKFHQKLLPLHTMPYIIDQHTKGFERFNNQHGKNDVWISQAVFAGWQNSNGQLVSFRRKSTLASIATLFVDIDYYKNPALASKRPETIRDMILEKCTALGIPTPSIILDSGQGLQAKWFHEPLPRKALPRWEAAEQHLVKLFDNLGADLAVRDATRILRVLHTVNQKTGKLVRVLHADSAEKHTFNDLCDKLLPYTQEQIRDFRSASKDARKEKLSSQQKSAVINFNSIQGFSTRTLNWSRFTDLQMLLKLRNYDMGEGLREPLSFYLANQYALCHQKQYADPHIYQEILRLVKDTHPGVTHARAQEKAQRLLRLMKRASEGGVVKYAGKEYTPLYTPKNETLIDLFEISSDEMKSMSTIISPSEKKKRNAQLKKELRREAGAISREDYLANAVSNTKPWEELGISRATWYRKHNSKISEI